MRSITLRAAVAMGVGIAAAGSAAPAHAVDHLQRGYELVSPADSGGRDISTVPATGGQLGSPLTRERLVSPDGTAAFFTSKDGGIPGQAGADPSGSRTNPYVARLGDHGWITTGIGLPASRVRDQEIEGLSADLRQSVSGATFGLPLDPADPDPQAGPLETRSADLYLGHDGTDWRWVSNVGTGPTDSCATDPNADYCSYYAGADDLSHVIFGAWIATLPGGPGVFDYTGGRTRRISVGPDGQALVPQVGRGSSLARASADGTHVAFTWDDGQIYERIDDNRTVVVTRSRISPPDPPQGTTTMQGMSRDGRYVLFSTAERLLAADGDASRDIYRYDAVTDALTLVSGLDAVAHGNRDDCTPAYGVQGCDAVFTGVSADGSTVYFVSPEQNGTAGTANAPNIYRWYDGITTLAATVSVEDASSISGVDLSFPPYLNSYDTAYSRVADDGSWIVVTATANLTSYDAAGHREVYILRAGQPAECASCRPDGVAPGYDATFGPAQVSGSVGSRNQGANVTADGRFVYFQTKEALLDRDVNGRDDVYEYDAIDKTLALISPGDGNSDASFFSNSDDGKAVFFLTRETLAPGDRNGRNIKLYVARVGATPAPPAESPLPCVGEGCRPEATPSPLPADAATSIPGRSDNLPDMARPGAVRIGSLSAVAKRRWHRTGVLEVPVSGLGVTSRVNARITLHVGRGFKSLATGAKTVAAGKTTRLALRISRAGRALVARRQTLHVRITVQATPVGRAGRSTSSVAVTLKRPVIPKKHR